MNLAHRRGVGRLVAVLSVVGLSVGLPATSSVVAAAPPPRALLPQVAPRLPAGTTVLGTTPSGQVLHLDVVLAGRDPAGLVRAVQAVTTPGSPVYRRSITPAQFAATFGPSPAEVAQVSATLHDQGLTVGTLRSGSTLLPVSGPAAAVSAVFSTALASVQAPDHSRAVVNTSAPSVAASLGGLVTGVAGLDGVFSEHAMVLNAHRAGTSTAVPHAGTSATPTGAAVAHAGTPQACPSAQALASGGTYTTSQLASVFGLDQVFAQGRTGVGQTIGIVEFERYLPSDFDTFESCFGLSNSIRNVPVDGGATGPPAGTGEAALDTELAAANAPSASLVVYEAPNSTSDLAGLDLFQQIATDDVAKVVTTSWGDCEAHIPTADRNAENVIFEQMALQGQTVVAASGDAGSEDCYPDASRNSTALAVDDPGSQPDVVSAGGTSLTADSASSQTVWNNCQGPPTEPASSCAAASLTGGSVGAGGGGYSAEWPRNPGQPAPSGFPGGDTNPCMDVAQGCRAVPDISYPSDPGAGSVVAYFSGALGGWTAFGGTSAAAPANAGLFADTDQGCAATLGAVGPALYAAGSANFTDIGSGKGNNDFTNTDSGGPHFQASPGYDPASGLGSPVDQKLSLALQGGDGCPSVAAVSPNTGPVAGNGAVTVFGGGLGDATTVTFGSAGAGQIVGRSVTSLTVIPPAAPGPMCVDVTVANPRGVSANSAADDYGFGGDLNCGQGYRFVASDGGIFDFGDAGFLGSTGNLALNQPIVGMATTPSTNGYWLVASDGGIFTFGDAPFFGSAGNIHLNRPIVGMAATSDGGGYWLVASDGGVFTYGDAPFFGSAGNIHLNRPIVGMAATSDGGGYWLVASDGGVFTYGDAPFFGSAGNIHLNSPIVGMAATIGGGGYWLVASDGGIFTYGDARFFGSAGNIRLNRPVVGMAAAPDGGGYWLVASDGGVFTYGDAVFYGSTGGIVLNKPIVGISGA